MARLYVLLIQLELAHPCRSCSVTQLAKCILDISLVILRRSLSVIDQVLNAKPVHSVYEFPQADYDLILIAQSIVQETQYEFKEILIHSNQDKHKKWDK